MSPVFSSSLTFLAALFVSFLYLAESHRPRLLVAAVAEGLDGVDVEGMLALTHGGVTSLAARLLTMSVYYTTVLLHTTPQLRWQRFRILLGMITEELQPQLLELRPRQREQLSAPGPLHDALTVVADVIVGTGGTLFPCAHGGGLEPVREDDVGVHGAHVEMIDDRSLGACGSITQHFQLINDLLAHGCVIDHIGPFESVLHLDGEGEHGVHGGDQLLEGRWVESELRRKIGAIDARGETLNGTADIGVGSEEMALVEARGRLQLLVGVDDAVGVRLHHQQHLTESPRSLPQHILRHQRDHGAQRVDEQVNILHIEIIRRHRVRYAVAGHVEWILHRLTQHILRVHLHRVISQLRPRHRLQSLGSVGKVRVALHPRERVQVHFLT